MRNKKPLTSLIAMMTLALSGLGPVSADTAGDPGGTLSMIGVRCPLIAPGGFSVGPTSCPGVRPGAKVISEEGSCTLNFLFEGSDGHRYIGTAGHCAPKIFNGGDVVWRGAGPAAADSSGTLIGSFAYAYNRNDNAGVGGDFALIRLDDSVPASSEMCGFGGPTGINRDLTSDPVVLDYFGVGLGAGTANPGRTGFSIRGMTNANAISAEGFVVPGDSGAPVISDDGRAVGFAVTLLKGADDFKASPGLSQATSIGTMGILRIGPQISRASERLGITLYLATAPRSS